MMDSVFSLLLALSLGIIVAEIITGRPKGPPSALTNYPNQIVELCQLKYKTKFQLRTFHQQTI